MSNLIQLPDYQQFCDQIKALSLPISASKVHGVMCGYICASALQQGDAYLRTLSSNKRGEAARVAAQSLFHLYSASQEQIDADNFSFQLLLPDDEEPLRKRARAFSEWCLGFTQAMAAAGINIEQLEDEETRDALFHLDEFSKLDFESLKISEDDEKAFMEVNEYARMAVLRLYWDFKVHGGMQGHDFGQIKH